MSSKLTVASLAERVDEQDAKLNAILAAVSGEQADEPKPSTSRRTSTKGKATRGTTTRKSTAKRRKLDDGDAKGFPVADGHVITTNAKGLLNASRFRPDGMVRSLDRATVEALADHGDVLLDVVETIGEGILPWSADLIVHVGASADDILSMMDTADESAGIGEYVEA